MATGSTYDFELNRDEIIQDALANVGAVGPNRTPTGNQTAHAARVLNRLVKSMDHAGLYLWRVVRRTFTTTDGTASYSLAADVLSVDEPLSFLPAASGSTRTTLAPMTRDEYMSLADRTTESSRPTLYFFEKTLANASLILWPVPDTTGETVEYSATIKSRDFDTAANTPDFPAHWNQMLIYGLSAELAPVYGQVALAAHFRALFKAEQAELTQQETEQGNLCLVPFGSY